nr:M1 family peptidase [Flavisolibacter sp.]
ANVEAAIPQRLGEQVVMQRVAGPQRVVEDISKQRNRMDTSIRFYSNIDTSLRDFYWRYSRGFEPVDTSLYQVNLPARMEVVDDATKQQIQQKHFYELHFSNKGGLVMPIIIEWTYADGTKEVEKIPAQVWRLNENRVTKFFSKDKQVTGILLDPMKETADIDESNNVWGGTTAPPRRFDVFKARQAGRGQSSGINPMQKAQEKRGF